MRKVWVSLEDGPKATSIQGVQNPLGFALAASPVSAKSRRNSSPVLHIIKIHKKGWRTKSDEQILEEFKRRFRGGDNQTQTTFNIR
jgi:hypothetical protein